jgi:hypothetical protein
MIDDCDKGLVTGEPPLKRRKMDDQVECDQAERPSLHGTTSKPHDPLDADDPETNVMRMHEDVENDAEFAQAQLEEEEDAKRASCKANEDASQKEANDAKGAQGAKDAEDKEVTEDAIHVEVAEKIARPPSLLSQASHPFWTQARRWVLDPVDAARCRNVCRVWNMTFAQPVHPRDRRLRFDEPSHTYFIDGKRGQQLQSVTTWIHSFFAAFNADDVIPKMRRGRKWNEDNPLFGKTDDEIKLIWKLNGEAASRQGMPF